ncbi:hypothetical protein BdWA1_000057 [Babesia duncani]|uniref:Uncharacterized protein n=1 Tax=Babesia duncani TaxID=323732 RepID=A0AAD9PLL1_9APIC|nr:hypothetical protein BdWA1_000057 [Babesia duncani]
MFYSVTSNATIITPEITTIQNLQTTETTPSNAINSRCNYGMRNFERFTLKLPSHLWGINFGQNNKM